MTASGYQAAPRITAACPREMLGAVILVHDIGILICEDTGSAIHGQRIDLYMDDHDEALAFGVRRHDVEVIHGRM